MRGAVRADCLYCGADLAGKRGYVCAACVRRRHNERLRDPAVRARWNRSARAKLVKARYADRHADEIRERSHQRHLRTYRSIARPLVVCAIPLCGAVFVRPLFSPRRYCDDCAAFYNGRAYLRWRSIPRPGRRKAA